VKQSTLKELASFFDSFNVNTLKVIYWILRGISLCYGFAMGIIFIASIINPTILFDYQPVPSFRHWIMRAVQPFLYAVLFLLPNRWTLSHSMFYLRLILIAVPFCRVLWLLFTNLVRGNDVIIAIQLTGVFVIIFGSMPTTLLLKRYFHQKTVS
jgi:hypothetical protein